MNESWHARLLRSPMAIALLSTGWTVTATGVDHDYENDGDDEEGRPIMIPTASAFVTFAKRHRRLRFYSSRWDDTAYVIIGGEQYFASRPEDFPALESPP